METYTLPGIRHDGDGSALRVLVVAPHQDDEAIGCGGVLAAYRAAGATTGVAFLSTTAGGDPIGSEARRAAECLGVSQLFGMGAPPVGAVFSQPLLLEMVRVVRTFRPHVLYAPHADEDDAQHRTVAALAREAAWLAAYPLYPECGPALPTPIGELYGYEVWTPISRPTHLVDITPHAGAKREAILAYASQIEITRFEEATLGLNRYRGIMHGAGDYAEAFLLCFSRSTGLPRGSYHHDE